MKIQFKLPQTATTTRLDAVPAALTEPSAPPDVTPAEPIPVIPMAEQPPQITLGEAPTAEPATTVHDVSWLGGSAGGAIVTKTSTGGISIEPAQSRPPEIERTSDLGTVWSVGDSIRVIAFSLLPPGER